jgi:hypothetical protein
MWVLQPLRGKTAGHPCFIRTLYTHALLSSSTSQGTTARLGDRLVRLLVQPVRSSWFHIR